MDADKPRKSVNILQAASEALRFIDVANIGENGFHDDGRVVVITKNGTQGVLDEVLVTPWESRWAQDDIQLPEFRNEGPELCIGEHLGIVHETVGVFGTIGRLVVGMEIFERSGQPFSIICVCRWNYIQVCKVQIDTLGDRGVAADGDIADSMSIERREYWYCVQVAAPSLRGRKVRPYRAGRCLFLLAGFAKGDDLSTRPFCIAARLGGPNSRIALVLDPVGIRKDIGPDPQLHTAGSDQPCEHRHRRILSTGLIA